MFASLTTGTIVSGEDTTSGSGATTTQTDPVVAAANAEKAVADAKKAAADAQAAQAQAELAALKAKVGEVPASGYTGNVDLKENAGSLESSLLASAAIVEATAEIAKRIPCTYKNKSVLLTGMSDVPTFNALMTFNAQLSILETAMKEASNASATAQKIGPILKAEPLAFAAAIPAAGLVLDAANKLLNFFKADYTVGGIQTALDESIVSHALAGTLAASGKFKDILIPNLFNPTNLSEKMVATLTKLETDRISAKSGEAEEATAVKSYAEKVGDTEKVKAAADAALKKAKPLERPALEKKAKEAASKLEKTKEGLEAHNVANAGWKKAVALHDAFFVKIMTMDEKGVVPLSQIVKEEAINAKINDGLMLITKLQSQGGSYYTKKNMWTALGAMPFYNSGGAVISYLLVEGADRKVILSGVVPFFGGYLKPTEISTTLNASSNTIPKCPVTADK